MSSSLSISNSITIEIMMRNPTHSRKGNSSA